MRDIHRYASREQVTYAKVLEVAVKIGFVLLVLSFLLYVSGILKPLVPLDQLSRYWGLSAAEFVKATGTPTGWAWLRQASKGDLLNMIGIVVLPSVSIFGILAVMPIFSYLNDKAHVIMSALLIVVLLVSASNLLASQ